MRLAAGFLFLLLTAMAPLGIGVVQGEETEEFVPQMGKFPPPGTGHYFAGELVVIDPINRRGGLRLDGDFTSDRYHRAPPHHFAMLPYGTVMYHGAPAELRDIPIGTHLHGYFVLPPEGDKSIPEPDGSGAKYVPKYNHAISVADDFSFYQTRGQSWRIDKVDMENGILNMISVGQSVTDGLTGQQKFHLDRATRVWKGRESVELEDLAAGQEVQVNLTWAPQWENKEFHLSDVWIDDESRKIAAERQRQIHIRWEHHHWLAGWIDDVEHQEAGRGIVTITLFGGKDKQLYDEVRAEKGFAVAVAESTLRTWWQEHDNKSGRLVELLEIADPATGSSGIQLRIQIGELLEGYRPNRIVRVRCSGWPNVKIPPEERIFSLEQVRAGQ